MRWDRFDTFFCVLFIGMFLLLGIGVVASALSDGTTVTITPDTTVTGGCSVQHDY